MTAPHDLPLVSTVAVGLSLAFICGLIATKLRLPPLVGYILAGVIIGPHSPGFTADIAIAEQLSEIGVVLLLFGVGLHFSVQDFMEVRKIAFFGATLRILIISALCVFVSNLWGWSLSTGLLFGLALSVASTVVLLRTLEEHHLVSSLTGKIAVGWLIVEDVVMVLALVLIPTLAQSVSGDSVDQSTMITNVVIAIGKIVLFAVLMFVVGRRALPWILTAVSRTGSRELFTLAVFSMAMGIAFGAAMLFGVSFALGAFFAGMMIRESDLNHEVADRALPFQDAFAVLFFVAVGMLFDPRILIEAPDKVAFTVFIIVAAKAAVTFFIMMAFHYPMKTRIKLAIGLAQIGEFSFILIALGASLGLLPEDTRNLILGGALISIAINPVLFLTFRNIADKMFSESILEDDALAHLKNDERKTLKNLVILIGHGRVGTSFEQKLDKAHVDLVIIDRLRERVEALREKGFHAIAGEATEVDILKEALIDKAFAVVVTVPDPFEARRIVELVRDIKPDAKIIVRSHNDDETAFFEMHNVDFSVTAHEEIGRRMVNALEDMNLPKHA